MKTKASTAVSEIPGRWIKRTRFSTTSVCPPGLGFGGSRCAVCGLMGPENSNITTRFFVFRRESIWGGCFFARSQFERQGAMLGSRHHSLVGGALPSRGRVEGRVQLNLNFLPLHLAFPFSTLIAQREKRCNFPRCVMCRARPVGVFGNLIGPDWLMVCLGTLSPSVMIGVNVWKIGFYFLVI